MASLVGGWAVTDLEPNTPNATIRLKAATWYTSSPLLATVLVASHLVDLT